MKCLFVFLPILTAGCVHKPAPVETDLDIYSATALVGPHRHPADTRGERLEAAEADLSRRRDIMRAWLVSREGREAIEKSDNDLDELYRDVDWSWGSSVSLDYEWSRVRRVGRYLKELERRHNLAQDKKEP